MSKIRWLLLGYRLEDGNREEVAVLAVGIIYGDAVSYVECNLGRTSSSVVPMQYSKPYIYGVHG